MKGYTEYTVMRGGDPYSEYVSVFGGWLCG